MASDFCGVQTALSAPSTAMTFYSTLSNEERDDCIDTPARESSSVREDKPGAGVVRNSSLIVTTTMKGNEGSYPSFSRPQFAPRVEQKSAKSLSTTTTSAPPLRATPTRSITAPAASSLAPQRKAPGERPVAKRAQPHSTQASGSQCSSRRSSATLVSSTSGTGPHKGRLAVRNRSFSTKDAYSKSWLADNPFVAQRRLSNQDVFAYRSTTSTADDSWRHHVPQYSQHARGLSTDSSRSNPLLSTYHPSHTSARPFNAFRFPASPVRSCVRLSEPLEQGRTSTSVPARIPTTTVIDWTSPSTRAREYDKIVRSCRGLRGLWRKVAPKWCRRRSSGRVGFFNEKEEAESDAGSVRRYRVPMPGEDAGKLARTA